MKSATPHLEPPTEKRPFVPHGVDAGSWLGFEQRIQERRFRALVESAREALAAGDGDAAQVALAEARTLRPDSAELDAFEQPPIPPSVDEQRQRAGGAVALLAVGVALLLAVDAFRYPAAAPVEPIARGTVMTLKRSVPVPVATTGILDEARPAEERPRPAIETIEESGPPITRPREPVTALPSDVARMLAIAVEPERDTALSVVGPPAPAASAAVEVQALTASAIAPVAPAIPADRPGGETGVTATLQRYARAYTDLDAQAARRVWPSVDERALSNAFAGLAAQELDFQNCEVVVREVDADAVCRGTASYIPRVGSSSPRVEPRTWHFELSRHGDAWLIDTAVARR